MNRRQRVESVGTVSKPGRVVNPGRVQWEPAASSFTGVIAPEADLRARSLVNREADGYRLISATLFELGEAGAVVSTEVAV